MEAMNLQYKIDPETGNMHVSGVAECGKAFGNCAVVLDPDSENPCLLLKKPLGFAAVRKILEHVEALGKAN